ncbi:hypothetical protein U1701_00460 [Sphingomonas sp. PB2P19]|uniref:hypothetical protein n=1 Tax=Sphingomonas rhamnosi TaxID=3096156 RepID=UPI002FC6CF4E
MPNPTAPIDYEILTLTELEAAAKSTTADQRRAHLDQAGIFAAAGEADHRSRARSPEGVE